MAQPHRVRLAQIYPPDTSTETNVDIIAIHGLDTKSPDTWIWKSKRPNESDVNWLADPHMLPSKSIPTTLEESAQVLLYSIRCHLTANRRAGEDRPVLFIASCLGGIILIKALEIDGSNNNDSPSLRRAIRGIIFLATPFGGTAFKDMPNLILKVWASLQDQTVTALVDYAKGPTPDLDGLVGKFIQLQRDKDYHVFTFWEAKTTALLHKFYLAWVFSNWMFLAWLAVLTSTWLVDWFSPWLLVLFLPWLSGFSSCQPKQKGKVANASQLVDRSSASARVFESQRLNRSHVQMNKFCCPTDHDFEDISRKVEEILGKIRKGTLLQQADAWIRDKHYTADRLKIERLSGDLLPMAQCYINLAIVEQPSKITDRLGEGSEEEGTVPQSSPISLQSRLKVETPDKRIQIELPTIFNPRKGPDGHTTQPRRIFIRGRAGVGKTTLCKKIVYDFTHHKIWSGLFDRVLWVPLRRLKGRTTEGYNLEDLFYYEYFSGQGHDDGRHLAKELWRTLKHSNSGKTLFILDGLDEVSEDLRQDDDMFRFLRELLNQLNVIITSRPYANLPADLSAFDLELETVGFYPNQVKDYLEKAFPDPGRVDEVQSFLQGHWLIQGLVRIPIQLDALCFTWSEAFGDKIIPQTMTAIYKAIEQSLWKKDILRLDKNHLGGRPVTEGDIKTFLPSEIKDFAGDEIYLLEVLAFTGLSNDIIDFDSDHRNAISEQFKLTGRKFLLDKTLARLSFLRTSDPSAKARDRSYHFLHLTFQEYFMARYFIRQWKAREPLEYLVLKGRKNKNTDSPTDPVEFLRKHKYTAHYDVVWRFAAGLLDAEEEEETLRFFRTIEEEPLDLLGPTHQRLVMHCLSEVSTKMSLRKKLEERLSQWLLFECKFTKNSHLASEVEFPEPSLDTALREGSDDIRIAILQSLTGRPRIPSSIIKLAASWLGDDTPRHLRNAVCSMIKRSKSSLLSDETLEAVAVRLEDEDSYARLVAIAALGSRSSLSDEILKPVAARLEDKNGDVRGAAIKALGSQSSLPDKILKAVAARLEHEDRFVRTAAIRALCSRPSLPDEILKAIAARLEDEDEDGQVRGAVVEALCSRSSLSDEILKAVAARLEDEDEQVGGAVVKALCSRSSLSDEILKAIAARLEDKNSDVRWAAANTLGSQSSLPGEILKAMAALLGDEDGNVRSAAVGALGSQSSLSDEILKAVAVLLEDEDRYARQAAIEALCSRPSLSDEILKAVAAQLEHENSHVRRIAMKALCSRPNLSDEILKAIAARLEDEDGSTRWATMRALCSRPNPSDEILKAVAARLEHKSKLVRMAAMKALSSRPSLPDEILKAMSARLEDKDRLVRRAATKALDSQSSLSDEILEAVAARLEHEDRFVRRAAIRVLGSKSNLPDEILKAVAAQLEDEHWGIREVATKALDSRSSLSDEILKAIAAQLEHEDSGVRRTALKILCSRSSLSNEILEAIAILLESKRASDEAEAILRIHRKFYSALLNGPFVKSLYQILLRRSFREHCSWYVEDGASCVNMPDGVRKTHIGNQQEFRDMVNKARPVTIPSIGDSVRDVDERRQTQCRST